MEDTNSQEMENQAGSNVESLENTNDAPIVENLGVTESPEETIRKLLQANAESSQVSPSAPVVEPAPAPVVDSVKDAAADNGSDFDQLISSLKLKGTSEEKSLIHTIEMYIESMKPGKPVRSVEGAQSQYTLWMALFNVIHNAPSSQFKSLWNIVLGFFVKHEKGALGECYYNRFSEMWKYDTNQLTAFQRLLNLISLTANPATREVGLRQVNLDVTLSKGFSEDGRNRLIAFYKR